MNAITKATSVVVLIALGLTLAAQAAEPAATPTAETRNARPDWSKFNWVKLGAGAVAEYAKPLPPGIHGKSQFCAPRFAFQTVEGAKQYRFTVTHWDKDRKNLTGEKFWVFEAAEPSASLLPVWNDLPLCANGTWLRVAVEGLDAKGGRPVPAAPQVSFFRKGQEWTDPFAKAKVSVREGAMEAIRRSMADGTGLQYTFYKDHRLPIEGKRDPELAKRFARFEPVFVAGGIWIASSSSLLARETQDPQEKALALRTARNAMDTVIACANPADWKYGFYANMLRDPGPHWKGYLSGEKMFEEWLADMHARSAARYEMMQDCMVCEPGFAFLNVYDVTQDQKYLDAAKRLAKAYADTQLPSGGWPYFVNAKTGEPLGAEYPPALTVLFLDRLATQYGIRDFVPAADRAFQWIMDNQVKTFDHRSHFWDIGPRTGPGGSQGALAGAEIAMCLFARGEKAPRYIALGEEYLRRVENGFIWWQEGGGGRVSEQTAFMARIGFSGGGVAQAFARAFEATGDPLYLAKAMSLARALNVAHAGRYVWGDYSAPRWAINLLEMHQFLKKHDLQDWPGLSANPETLTFALANPSDGSGPQQVAILYRGSGADKPFTMSAADPWVKITAGAGEGNGRTFAVSVEPKGLPSGIHASKVIVARSDIPETLVLPVRLRLGTPVPKVITIIYPTAGRCRSKGELRYVVGVRDQFGEPFDTELRWSVSGGGMITPQGVFTSDGAAGEFTVTVAATGNPSVSAATVLRVLPPDCFARWKLDEAGGTIVADAWGSNAGEIVGGATRVPGKAGGALRFDGKGQYVQTETILDDLKLPCTFAFWVNPDATQGSLANIFGNHEGSTHGLVMQQAGGAANNFYFGYGSQPVGGGAGPVQLTAGTWQHVAIVCDGKEVVIYLDGKETARGEGKNPLTPNPRLGFRLGSGYSGGRFLNGALDDFRIYSRALSVEEVGELTRETDK